MKNFKLKAKTKKVILTKKGRLNKNILHALEVSGVKYSKDGKLYPVHTSGRGRFKSNIDLSHYVTSILDAQGYKYKTGNDAPRGGKTGNYIKMSQRALNFLRWVINEYK